MLLAVPLSCYEPGAKLVILNKESSSEITCKHAILKIFVIQPLIIKNAAKNVIDYYLYCWFLWVLEHQSTADSNLL